MYEEVKGSQEDCQMTQLEVTELRLKTCSHCITLSWVVGQLTWFLFVRLILFIYF